MCFNIAACVKILVSYTPFSLGRCAHLGAVDRSSLLISVCLFNQVDPIEVSWLFFKADLAKSASYSFIQFNPAQTQNFLPLVSC